MINSENDDSREVLTAKISRKSMSGWRNFCKNNGVSVTAMIEVTGLGLVAETTPPMTDARVRMVELARSIDLERRSRRKSRD